MDTRKTALYGSFPVNSAPASFPTTVPNLMDLRIPNNYHNFQNNLSFGHCDNGRSQKYDESFISSVTSLERRNNKASNDLIMNRNSVIITNSNLKTMDSNQSLSRLVFKDKICFALPPGVTWEELNASPLSGNESTDLLYYTMEMNSQLKKNRRRAKNNKSRSMSTDSIVSLSGKQETIIKSSVSNSFVKSRLKKKNSEIIAKNTDHLDDRKDHHIEIKANTDSNFFNLSKNSKSKKMELADILALKNQKYENPDIIKSLKKFNILKQSSTYYGHKNSKNSKNCIKDGSQCKSLPSLMSINVMGIRDSKPSDPIKIDLDLKKLMEASWLESEDETTSKQIYEKLNDVVKDFKKNVTESGNVTQAEKSGNEAEFRKLEIDTMKKKKEKKKWKQGTKDNLNIEMDASFEKYYDELTIQEGLKNGTMFKEILRINHKNCNEAFISCSSDDTDIFIDGIQSRNRALDGDEVVVELFPEEMWKTFANNTVQRCGKVVFITKKNHTRQAVGHFKIDFCNLNKTSFPEPFILPVDDKLPRIKIPFSSCPTDIFNKLKKYKTLLFLAQIMSWEKVNYAEGLLLLQLGEEHKPETETRRILLENCLNVKPFESVNDYLPSLPYVIPKDEIRKRFDIRSCCVFSIDPPTAEDLDDALSCTLLPNGNIEVGIHIADVTHFVQPNTPLDKDIRQKATTVYLTQTVFHMLPKELCKLCSLTPNSDKLAFSLFVELDSDVNIIEHRFCKTVMRSCAKLAYSHAQDIIDNGELYDAESFPVVGNGYSAKDCVETISRLYELAMKMRKRRFKEGALKIDKPKIEFTLDKKGLPSSYSLYIGRECNWLVEEFMLLANILAANKIREHFPDRALLRFHTSPKKKYLFAIAENLEKIGIFIDMTSAGSIYKSMMQYEGSDEIGMARMTVITNVLTKPMTKACYVCSSSNVDDCSDYWHYALNTPFYTHFTSPIRRYADVIVHRLLASCLGHAEVPSLTPDDIQNIADNCNKKKNSSKKASEMSTEFYLRLYVKKYGPIRVRAVVIEVKERYFDVIDLSARSTNRIFVHKISDVDKIHFKEDSTPTLKLEWKGRTSPQIIQIFTIIDIELYCSKYLKKSLNKIEANLLKPS